jgi:hypothetical protein
MIHARLMQPGESPVWRELRLRALADAPDAFGETLADAHAGRGTIRPPLDTHIWRTAVADRNVGRYGISTS